MHGEGVPHGPCCKAKPPASTETPAACIPPVWRPPLKAPCMPGAPGTPPRPYKPPAPRLQAPSPRMRNATLPQVLRPPRHVIRGDAACTAKALRMRHAAKPNPLQARRPQPPAFRPRGDRPRRHRASPARPACLHADTKRLHRDCTRHCPECGTLLCGRRGACPAMQYAVTPHAPRRRSAWAMLQKETPCKHRHPSRVHFARVATASEGIVHVWRAGTPPRRHKTPAPRRHAPSPRMRNATLRQAPLLP